MCLKTALYRCWHLPVPNRRRYAAATGPQQPHSRVQLHLILQKICVLRMRRPILKPFTLVKPVKCDSLYLLCVAKIRHTASHPCGCDAVPAPSILRTQGRSQGLTVSGLFRDPQLETLLGSVRAAMAMVARVLLRENANTEFCLDSQSSYSSPDHFVARSEMAVECLQLRTASPCN